MARPFYPATGPEAARSIPIQAPSNDPPLVGPSYLPDQDANASSSSWFFNPFKRRKRSSGPMSSRDPTTKARRSMAEEGLAGDGSSGQGGHEYNYQQHGNYGSGGAATGVGGLSFGQAARGIFGGNGAGGGRVGGSNLNRNNDITNQNPARTNAPSYFDVSPPPPRSTRPRSAGTGGHWSGAGGFNLGINTNTNKNVAKGGGLPLANAGGGDGGPRNRTPYHYPPSPSPPGSPDQVTPPEQGPLSTAPPPQAITNRLRNERIRGGVESRGSSAGGVGGSWGNDRSAFGISGQGVGSNEGPPSPARSLSSLTFIPPNTPPQRTRSVPPITNTPSPPSTGHTSLSGGGIGKGSIGFARTTTIPRRTGRASSLNSTTPGGVNAGPKTAPPSPTNGHPPSFTFPRAPAPTHSSNRGGGGRMGEGLDDAPFAFGNGNGIDYGDDDPIGELPPRLPRPRYGSYGSGKSNSTMGIPPPQFFPHHGSGNGTPPSSTAHSPSPSNNHNHSIPMERPTKSALSFVSSTHHAPSTVETAVTSNSTTADGSKAVGAGGRGSVIGGRSTVGSASIYMQSFVERSLIGEVRSTEAGELNRDWDFFSSWSMGVSNVGYLPGVYFGAIVTLNYGGTSMLTIFWPITGVFMTILSSVMAEQASAYPVAGAMFTWVFRLSRAQSSPFKKSARFLSWLAGSFLLCAHILTHVVISWQFALALQSCVGVYSNNYTPTLGKTLGLSYAIQILCGIIVSLPISRHPRVWHFAGFLILSTFLVTNVVLLVFSKHKRSLEQLFTSYENSTTLSSRPYVYYIGWILSCLGFGADACAHISEETKAPTRTVPTAMFWTTAMSYILGWISMCILLGCMHPDTKSMLAKHSDFAPAQILLSSLPQSWAMTLLVLTVLVMFFQDVAQLLASSRFAWALARDSALPFSHLFKRLSKKNLPIASAWLIVVFAVLSITIIAANESLVTNLITEANGLTFIVAYIFPIAVYLFCDKDALVLDGRSQWTIRGLSRPLGMISVIFSIAVVIGMSLPTSYPVRPLSFPYAPITGFAVFILSCLTWIFYGNSRYAGPIKATFGNMAQLPKAEQRAKPTETSREGGGKGGKIFVQSLSTVLTSREPGARGGTGDSSSLDIQELGTRELEAEGRVRPMAPTPHNFASDSNTNSSNSQSQIPRHDGESSLQSRPPASVSSSSGLDSIFEGDQPYTELEVSDEGYSREERLRSEDGDHNHDRNQFQNYSNKDAGGKRNVQVYSHGNDPPQEHPSSEEKFPNDHNDH